jgi:hypothetical protein
VEYQQFSLNKYSELICAITEKGEIIFRKAIFQYCHNLLN